MRSFLAAVSPLALADLVFGNAGSNLFATPVNVASPSAYAYTPQQLEQMQYANAVPYVQQVAYVEEAGTLSGYNLLGFAERAASVGFGRCSTMYIRMQEIS